MKSFVSSERILSHTHTHTHNFLYNFCDFNSRFSLFLMLSSLCCHCIISNFIWFYFIYREILDTHTHTHTHTCMYRAISWCCLVVILMHFFIYIFLLEFWSRYSDFIVNEVDKEGNVAHLTSLDAPQEEVIRIYGFVFVL